MGIQCRRPRLHRQIRRIDFERADLDTRIPPEPIVTFGASELSRNVAARSSAPRTHLASTTGNRAAGGQDRLMRSDVVGMSGHSVVIGRDQDIRADLLQELLDSSHDVGSGAARRQTRHPAHPRSRHVSGRSWRVSVAPSDLAARRNVAASVRRPRRRSRLRGGCRSPRPHSRPRVAPAKKPSSSGCAKTAAIRELEPRGKGNCTDLLSKITTWFRPMTVSHERCRLGDLPGSPNVGTSYRRRPP